MIENEFNTLLKSNIDKSERGKINIGMNTMTKLKREGKIIKMKEKASCTFYRDNDLACSTFYKRASLLTI
jgi:hypothetical protein